ncbi:HutD/Ves family protein [Ruegeria atlantica]|uniref:HutD/Ves family protein n=1 Tax=Ruegeria atlantica TaxID=81569 RepID=UPI002494587D|nr:HutD family protein [Ruegeria atlantica]
MKHVRTRTLEPILWKNGLGTTREIARGSGEQGVVWRVSLADVEADGPFSTFPGMSHILTVVEGDGFDLVGPATPLNARFSDPLRFSGDLELWCRLEAGPVRNFNVIFDPVQCAASVDCLTGEDPHKLQAGPNEVLCLFSVNKGCSIDGNRVEPTEAAILKDGNFTTIGFEDSITLLARLKNR